MHDGYALISLFIPSLGSVLLGANKQGFAFMAGTAACIATMFLLVAAAAANAASASSQMLTNVGKALQTGGAVDNSPMDNSLAVTHFAVTLGPFLMLLAVALAIASAVHAHEVASRRPLV